MATDNAAKCKEHVHDDFGVGFHPCIRRAVRDGYCRQHHPDAYAERQAKSLRRYQERINKKFMPHQIVEWLQKNHPDLYAKAVEEVKRDR